MNETFLLSCVFISLLYLLQLTARKFQGNIRDTKQVERFVKSKRTSHCKRDTLQRYSNTLNDKLAKTRQPETVLSASGNCVCGYVCMFANVCVCVCVCVC